MLPMADAHPAPDWHTLERRLRPWYMEKKLELGIQFDNMKREINARLGQELREALRQNPNDHQAVVKLCRAADTEEVKLGRALREGLQEEANRRQEELLSFALIHPNQSASLALEEILARISRDPQAASPYCSPVLLETLFHEGSDHLPNAHRKWMELDFPQRIESLLDFHCIAFHTDVDVLKKIYNDEIISDKEKRKEVLRKHKAEMEKKMRGFSKEMKQSWTEEKERLRLQREQSLGPRFSEWQGDWMDRAAVSRRMNDGVDGTSNLAHLGESHHKSVPTARMRASKKATQVPRSILKNRHIGTSVNLHNEDKKAESGLPISDEFYESDSPPSFWLAETMDAEDARGLLDKLSRDRLENEGAAAIRQRQRATTPRSFWQPPPHTMLDSEDESETLCSNPRDFPTHPTLDTDDGSRISSLKKKAKYRLNQH
ncbi:hypothetical protein B0H10DRAFT_2068353 [Mycena sp. CBHHK59/15]|nr:hypothetical protein B0H10DRAFT_2068353 [Mycena sp. CBHHK59/15]